MDCARAPLLAKGAAMSKLNELMARGTLCWAATTPFSCGAMSWVSERHLVSAISNAGGFGVIACGTMTPELLDAEIAATKALATRNFGVNLITMHPQLFELIEVCAKHGVGHVVLAGGLRRRATSRRSRRRTTR